MYHCIIYAFTAWNLLYIDVYRFGANAGREKGKSFGLAFQFHTGPHGEVL